MFVTKDFLEIELVNLKRNYQKMLDDGNAVSGAIQFCEHLLKTMSGNTLIPVAEQVEDSSPQEVRGF